MTKISKILQQWCSERLDCNAATFEPECWRKGVWDWELRKHLAAEFSHRLRAPIEAPLNAGEEAVMLSINTKSSVNAFLCCPCTKQQEGCSVLPATLPREMGRGLWPFCPPAPLHTVPGHACSRCPRHPPRHHRASLWAAGLADAPEGFFTVGVDGVRKVLYVDFRQAGLSILQMTYRSRWWSPQREEFTTPGPRATRSIGQGSCLPHSNWRPGSSNRTSHAMGPPQVARKWCTEEVKEGKLSFGTLETSHLDKSHLLTDLVLSTFAPLQSILHTRARMIFLKTNKVLKLDHGDGCITL